MFSTHRYIKAHFAVLLNHVLANKPNAYETRVFVKTFKTDYTQGT
jgi:hypothetical protein